MGIRQASFTRFGPHGEPTVGRLHCQFSIMEHPT